MRTITRTIAYLLGTLAVFSMLVSAASAQALQRTFVSGGGSDGNPCTRAAPCRTFTQAISQTSAGGEVVVLDSAGYGPLTISSSVSLICPLGVYAGIAVFSGDGIVVSAGQSDVVILRGLTVNNQGSNGDGIRFNTGGTLHIENCVVSGFSTQNGVDFLGPGKLEIKDSILRGNHIGVAVRPASGTAIAVIEGVKMDSNSTAGLLASDGSKVTVRNSSASANAFNGFLGDSSSSVGLELNIESCVASNNANGIVALSTSTGVATVRVSNCTVTDGGIGLQNVGAPALLFSRGNNTVEGNSTANTLGTVGPYSAK